ncbi:ABC transporter permease [Gluconacetobacter asukensis]|uniref:ABC transporter permease n=1 Tax=Gluconacetobacter asukensis TaxID=1017181 RepID=A0A7W4IYM6_9PROT|nr:ABC transporter permease [Gluconacetobacter asukensis]MBB2171469.1 ABC transporter permease [Gluconacetobacter asukensis]
MTKAAPTMQRDGAFRKPVHFHLSADRGWKQRFHLAWTDLCEGMHLWRLIAVLGFLDIKLRYRGSALGPFWLTASMGVQVAAMAFIYADLFHTDIHSYLPFLSLSIIAWNYLNALVTDGCACFIESDTVIKGMRMPFTVHAARSIVRNTIILAHNIIIIIAVFAIMGIHQSLYSLMAVPAFGLWLVDAFAFSLLFGALCARFRDVPQIISAVMQIAFFITPVMWNTNILTGHREALFLLRFNPFYYLFEILRAPLLGTPLTVTTWAWALVISGFLILFSWIAFARTRGRIAFWV